MARMPALRSLTVKNFRSLREVGVSLGALNVLVGPNAAGKSNLLEAIAFLGDVARTDLSPAVEAHGGVDSLLYRGKVTRRRSFSIAVTAQFTEFASANALDEYELFVQDSPRHPLMRRESFTFKRTKGAGRRIKVEGSKFEVQDGVATSRSRSIATGSAALSTLPRLGDDAGGPQVRAMAELFTTFYVFDPDVAAARQPSAVRRDEHLRPDARNLASYLSWLAVHHADDFAALVDDLRAIVPGLEALSLEFVGGATRAVKVTLKERGLRGRTDLAYASFGTVRAIALFAMLHDPHPPQLRCVEEIDHGLHPYALDRLVDRLRAASQRGQLILATHSPALVNRLRPDELIVCERDVQTGASLIPAISTDEVRLLMDGGELGLGELWFSGALGGNP